MHGKEHLIDSKFITGILGSSLSALLADFHVWLSILVGLATLLYVGLGIYMRIQRIKRDNYSDDV